MNSSPKDQIPPMKKIIVAHNCCESFHVERGTRLPNFFFFKIPCTIKINNFFDYTQNFSTKKEHGQHHCANRCPSNFLLMITGYAAPIYCHFSMRGPIPKSHKNNYWTSALKSKVLQPMFPNFIIYQMVIILFFYFVYFGVVLMINVWIINLDFPLESCDDKWSWFGAGISQAIMGFFGSRA